MTQAVAYPTTEQEVTRQILSQVQRVVAEDGGRGYGQVRIVIKAGRVITIHREHVTNIGKGGENG